MASCYIVARDTKNGRSYHVKYRRGGEAFPVEHGGAFPTRKAAELRKGKVLEWLAAGLNPQTQIRRLSRTDQTMGQLADAWLEGRVDIDASTRGIYRVHVGRVRDYFGDWEPEAVTQQDVAAFVASLSLAAGTVRQAVGVLRMILDTADLPANPARSKLVRLPRNERRTLEPPDAPHVLAMLRHAHSAHRACLVLLEQTGLRVSEALSLSPGDVDVSRVRVRAETTKTDRPRWVPCPEWLTDTLTLPLGGSRQAVYNAVRNGCAEANVQHFRTHDLRHRRASLWHQQGVPAVELARRLGHARPSMSLDVYSHVMPLEEMAAQDLVLLLT